MIIKQIGMLMKEDNSITPCNHVNVTHDQTSVHDGTEYLNTW